jgi:ABC-type molybdenum transport system ATPase subunit/photorepair protein PhrA
MKSSSPTLNPDRFTMRSSTRAPLHNLIVEIGEIPILIRTDSIDFAHKLRSRYGKFLTEGSPHGVMELDVELVKERGVGDRSLRRDDDGDVNVEVEGGRWVMERSDFRAWWDPERNRGWVSQRAHPHAIDAVLRILHSLLLARAGGFLVHAASVVRNGRAFVFAGVSGAGKSTLARLAPSDVTLLTDELSYVGPGSGARRLTPEVRNREPQFPIEGSRITSLNRSSVGASAASAFQAFGTPFVGELARIGQKLSAPLASLFLLKQGLENRIEPLSEAEAARELLRHVLFFARDKELVRKIFETILDFVASVPVCRLVFAKDPRVWELIT